MKLNNFASVVAWVAICACASVAPQPEPEITAVLPAAEAVAPSTEVAMVEATAELDAQSETIIVGQPKSVDAEALQAAVEQISHEVSEAVEFEHSEQGAAFPAQPSQLNVWNDAEFREQVLESYRAESDIVPAMSEEERLQLSEVQTLLADDPKWKGGDADAYEAHQRDRAQQAMNLLRESNSGAHTAIYDFFLGNLELQRGETGPAIEAYRAAVTKFPAYRQAWNTLGILSVQEGRFADASEAFTKVVELGGGSGKMYGLMGYAAARQGNHMSAETAYRMAILMDPQSMDWKIGLARSLFEQRQFPAAISLCENLIEAHPEKPELWLMQGEALARSGQAVEAAKNFEMVDRLGHASASSLNQVGDIYAREGLHGLAARSYMRALAHDPKKSEARALRGAQFLMGQGAVEWAEELIGAMESYADRGFAMKTQKEMLRIKASIAIQRDDADAEIAVLEQSLELDPLDGRTLIQVGQYKHRQGDLDNAIFYFERASKIDGFEGEARIAHGQALVREGRYTEAVPLLKQGLKIQPNERLKSYLETVERLARRS